MTLMDLIIDVPWFWKPDTNNSRSILVIFGISVVFVLCTITKVEGLE